MRPYPDHLTERLTLRDGSQVTIRPIRPEDTGIEQAFVRNLSAESRYFRFMESVRELSPQMLRQFTEVDYRLHMALVAVSEADGTPVQVAVARYVADDELQQCEFAIAVADEWQGKGLGARLLQALIASARAAGIRSMFGEVLAGNRKMLGLMAKLGFSVKFNDENPRVVRVEAGV